MPWFWGRSRSDDGDDEYYSSEYESYSEDEDGSSSYYDEDDEDQHHHEHTDEEGEDEEYEREGDGEEYEKEEKEEEVDNRVEEEENNTPAKNSAAAAVQEDDHGNGATSSSAEEEEEEGDSDGRIRPEELDALFLSSSTPPPPKNEEMIERHQAAPTTDGAVVGGYSNNMDDDDDDDELLASGTIPTAVLTTNRDRLPSAVSLEDDIVVKEDDDSNNNKRQENNNEEKEREESATATTTTTTPEQKTPGGQQDDEEEEEEEEEEATTLAEKQSLLVLAAEHDRVDILQAILSGSNNNNSSNNEENDETKTTMMLLMNPTTTTVPPLHIAVSYGSVHAVSCLLRMGADPSIRPNIASILEQQQQANNNASETTNAAGGSSPGSPAVEIPHMHIFDGQSAWELAFAKSDNNATASPSSRGSWALFGGSSSSLGDNSGRGGGGRGRGGGADIAPSKREGIRHAFTAEALRCIGSDEVDRLRQLLDAGMPSDTEIGNKTLLEWAVDMDANSCQEVLRGMDSLQLSQQQQEQQTELDDNNNPERRRKGSVLRNTDESSLSNLTNRLDELESLARALSTCCDNLAEEVSVCSGLLLVGSGGSALASHVRSLKARKERRYDEWQRMGEAWENCEDELAYWIRECGGMEAVEDDLRMIANRSVLVSSHVTNSVTTASSPSREMQTSGSSTQEDAPSEDEEASKQKRQQLKAQIGACENKIRMLRASIADLSDEQARNIAEVERRGLSGGIKLVRGLRDEIREIEFQLSECKSNEAASRAKISLLQAKHKTMKKDGHQQLASNSNAAAELDRPVKNDIGIEHDVDHDGGGFPANDEHDIPESERIATGQSRAIIVRQNSRDRGFLPFTIWQLLLRIIGLGDSGPVGNGEARPAMIV